jgi:hypothetical protein
VRIKQENGLDNLERAPSMKTNLVGTLILDFSTLKTVRNKLLLFKSSTLGICYGSQS